MKNTRKFASILAVFALLATIFMSSAQAQVTAQNLYTMTNLPATVNASSTTNQTSWIPIPKLGALAIQWTFNTSTNVGTDNCALMFTPSVDGTNASTTTVWKFLAPANGWTNTVAVTNFLRTMTEGYTYMTLSTITNLTYGTLTNKGVIVNRIYNID